MSALQQFSSDLAELVAKAAPGVVGLERRHGQGSGVVLSPDGYVLTNAHVVRGAGGILVRQSGDRAARADVVGVDERTDLAVVRADAGALAPLPLSDPPLRVGEVVIAIGNPLGFERTVTVGVVSALYRTLWTPRREPLDGLVQTDASINPGSSGGPLLDTAGRVVGITTAMLPWARGIGFAVPARTASWVATVLIQRGEVLRPFIGVACRGEDLPPGLAREAGHPRAVRVLEVIAASPAEGAGLRAGDLLVAAAGQPVQTLDDLVRALVLGEPGRVAVQVLRGGETLTLELAPRPAKAAA
jgi:S1-C subfamily serine protease